MPSGEYTTAEVRPNAYIPDSDLLPLPKPYGAQAPFKPSQPGANMRHFRKPAVKPLEIEDTTDWCAHKHDRVFMKFEVFGLSLIFNQNPQSCRCPSETFNLHLRNQQTFRNKWEFEFEFSIYFLRRFSFLSHIILICCICSPAPSCCTAQLPVYIFVPTVQQTSAVLSLCLYLWTASGCNCVSFFFIFTGKSLFTFCLQKH